MTGEPCRICDATVSFSDTVHVLLNPRGEEGVVDYYVCRNCYEEHLAPLFDSSAESSAAAPED